MISFAEYARHDGLALAALVRRGELSPAELLDAALARIDAVNPSLNAVVRRRDDAARAEAVRVDPAAPFAGVPFLVKDLLATVAGEPTGSGNRALAGVKMPHDSEMVRRYRRAGLLMAGRTATPEFGLTPYTEPVATGVARNPWSAAHSAGGSSGGSASAVAARMVPLASGGDGGGSIRVPAACCGLFGFKPSRGMTPSGPDLGELWHGFAIEHAITRSVRDSAALLDATAGMDPGAPFAAPLPARPFLDEVGADPGRLRIAFSRQALMGHGLHADCLAALDATAKQLQALGHDVEEASPPVDGEACAVAFVTVLAGQTRAVVEQVSHLLGHRPRAADFEPATYSLGLLGRAISAGDYVRAVATLQGAARRAAPFFETYDVLLTPTLGAPPAAVGALQPSALERPLMGLINALDAGWLLRALDVVQPLARKTFDYMPNTALFNASGQPAMSVPLHWNADGLPIGMQFAARLGGDALLFRLAAQLERAHPWFGRIAPGYA